MGKLTVFNFMTLNGFYKGPNEDISWHKQGDKGEESKFAEENLKSGNKLLFGRVTYEMMKSYWPTPMAQQNDPLIAEGMNNAEKIVFSKMLRNADWKNTRIVNDNIQEEVKKLKASVGDLTILGSGSIVTQLAENGLIDEYQLMIDPVAIGQGTPLFKNIQHQLDLKLVDSRTFKSGVILLSYVPKNKSN